MNLALHSILRDSPAPLQPVHRTKTGVLFAGDCLKVLAELRDWSVDMVFADPPFNLGKVYSEEVNDQRPDYLEWSQLWISECVRVLKPGGAIFIYNLPKWNIPIGAYLGSLGMLFRHWIAISSKSCLPIQGRLYPAHYSLLYFTKGTAKTFRKIRTPILKCRHCGGEIRDYGGHRNAMNPKGVNLTDFWDDIPPVRHWKFKSKKRGANQISTKLVGRAIEMSTYPGEIVLEPFGGSGTTFDVCESIGRRWVGIELANCEVIVERLEQGGICHHSNGDFVES